MGNDVFTLFYELAIVGNVLPTTSAAYIGVRARGRYAMGRSLGHVHDRSFVIRAFICGYFYNCCIARASSEGENGFAVRCFSYSGIAVRKAFYGYFFTHVTSFLAFVYFSV